MADTETKLAIGCLVNDETVLAENLLRSPMVQTGQVMVHVQNAAPSAAVGYNRILAETNTEIIILAHQDVYLPKGWDQMLRRRIDEVTSIDPNWGVLAAFGIEATGTSWGPVWSTSIGQIVGRVPVEPKPVECADEMLIVLRRTPQLRFDEGLPHFHFYGVDICQIARAQGHGVWAVSLPCIHNDGFKGALDENYDRCFQYVRKKWWARLPLPSPTVHITWHGLQLRRVKKAMKESFAHRQSIATTSQADPLDMAERCGWSSV